MKVKELFEVKFLPNDEGSLEGKASEQFSGDFNCSTTQLKSLKGGPRVVRGRFDCSGNELTSLEFAPEIANSFYCGMNQLTSLEHGPKHVIGDYWCDNNELITLEGAPKTVVNGIFNCSTNKNLKSFKGGPVQAFSFWAAGCEGIESFEDLPKRIKDDLDLTQCGISSLKGFHEWTQHVGGTLTLDMNMIEDGFADILKLDVLPKAVYFDVDQPKLLKLVRDHLKIADKQQRLKSFYAAMMDAELEQYI